MEMEQFLAQVWLSLTRQNSVTFLSTTAKGQLLKKRFNMKKIWIVTSLRSNRISCKHWVGNSWRGFSLERTELQLFTFPNNIAIFLSKLIRKIQSINQQHRFGSHTHQIAQEILSYSSCCIHWLSQILIAFTSIFCIYLWLGGFCFRF